MAGDTSSSRDPGSAGPVSARAGERLYWDDVGLEWMTKRPDRVWREYTDSLQISLLDRWIKGPEGQPGCAPPTALKTDLFDEVAGRGVVRHLLDRGFHTTGIDLSPVVVSEAVRSNPRLHGHCADVRELPFADASFNIIYSGSTLDHFATVVDIAQAVKELVRVLRPSGRLVLTLDNPLNPLVWLRNSPLLTLLRRFGIVPYHVGATLGPARLADLVRSNGLDVLQTTAILHYPRVLAVWRARAFEGREPTSPARFLEALARWEHLERWRSRFLSGHFIAILAIKQQSNVLAPLAARPLRPPQLS